MPYTKIISLADDGFYSCNDLIGGDALVCVRSSQNAFHVSCHLSLDGDDFGRCYGGK